jgi:hypothetical protein
MYRTGGARFRRRRPPKEIIVNQGVRFRSRAEARLGGVQRKAKVKEGEKVAEQWSCVVAERGVYALWLFLDAEVMAGWPRILNVSAAREAKVRRLLPPIPKTVSW